MIELLPLGIGLGGYYFLHSLLADERIKSVLQRKWIPQRYYRISYNMVAIVLLVPLFLVYQGTESRELFEGVKLLLLGIALMLAGMALLALALRQYDLGEFSGLRQLEHKKQDPENTLITTGLNHYVRHPLYFASLLLLWGFFLYLPTTKVLTIAVLSTVYLFIGTRLEEQKLLKEFGKAYLIYREKVPMLLPFTKWGK